MESKILRGGGGAVQLSYFMSLVLNGLFKMLFDCLCVVIDVFLVVVGC